MLKMFSCVQIFRVIVCSTDVWFLVANLTVQPIVAEFSCLNSCFLKFPIAGIHILFFATSNRTQRVFCIFCASTGRENKLWALPKLLASVLDAGAFVDRAGDNRQFVRGYYGRYTGSGGEERVTCTGLLLQTRTVTVLLAEREGYTGGR